MLRGPQTLGQDLDEGRNENPRSFRSRVQQQIEEHLFAELMCGSYRWREPKRSGAAPPLAIDQTDQPFSERLTGLEDQGCHGRNIDHPAGTADQQAGAHPNSYLTLQRNEYEVLGPLMPVHPLTRKV